MGLGPWVDPSADFLLEPSPCDKYTRLGRKVKVSIILQRTAQFSEEPGRLVH